MVALVILPGCGPKPGADQRNSSQRGRNKTIQVTAQERDALLARTRVWAPPAIRIDRVDFRAMALDLPVGPEGVLGCRFIAGHIGGTTPKFDCEISGGEFVRVKYGHNPEVHAEAAATRLLSALGFGADRVALVKVVRCFGCPYAPSMMNRILDFFGAFQSYRQRIDYSKYRDFEWASVERRLNAPAVISGSTEGWVWEELKKIDSTRGGATRKEVDALRLMAVFLNHWDNKSENQRLVCLAPTSADASCQRPFAIIQDTGGSFGPSKLDLDGWRASHIWSDASTCEVNMSHLPYAGATFAPVQISEDGRKFFAGLVDSLSEKQLRDLVETSRFAEYAGESRREERVAEWVAAFRDRIRQIVEHAPCPQM